MRQRPQSWRRKKSQKNVLSFQMKGWDAEPNVVKNEHKKYGIIKQNLVVRFREMYKAISAFISIKTYCTSEYATQLTLSNINRTADNK